MILEILIVFALTLVNGVLAMSELAIVSSRTARLRVMADNGSRGAAMAIRLAEDPGRFLSSVQIGITLVGVLAGAFSGATLGLRATAALKAAGMGEGLAQTLGVGGVVMLITYVSLVFGELVPKQIALRGAESVAVRIAPLLRFIPSWPRRWSGCSTGPGDWFCGCSANPAIPACRSPTRKSGWCCPRHSRRV